MAAQAQAQEQDTVLTNYLRKAQYQQAIEYIDTEEPARDLTYQKVLCYKGMNNYSKAIEILETLQKSYPDDIPVQLELAQCYETNLQYPKSIYWYQKLVEADPANTYFQVRKADLLYRAEKYATALENYLQIDPETYNPAYLKKSIALCYEKLNLPDSAKVYYRAAWEIDPHDVFSALCLVKLCIQQKDYEQALSDSETFLAGDTTNAQMNVLNAFTYYCLDQFDKASLRFEKCRTAGDSSLMVIRSLGISYFMLQNDSTAYSYLQQAYGRDTTNRKALYVFAQVNYNLQYYPDAILAYQKLIEQEMPNRNALCTYYTGLAQASEKDSLYQDAAKYYMTALEYTSSNVKRMDLFFEVASLAEFHLKNYRAAVYYYTQFCSTLLNYQNALSEKPDPDTEKIEAIESQLAELDKYIRNLKTEHGITSDDKMWTDKVWFF